MKTEEIHLPTVIGKGYASFWSAKQRYRVLKGGRGSKKSVTTALYYVYMIMKHPLSNALCVRKTFNTHKDSTFAQLKWAAKRLGVFDKWKFTINPLEAVYLPTGQRIIFRGFDDPLKLTSMTVHTGVLCWVWLEEAYEIEDEAEFDTLDESIRGEMPDGLWKQLTLTFNPWVNSHWTKKRFFDQVDPNAFTLTTTYLCNEFLDEADREKIELLKTTNPERYKVVGLGDYGIPGGTYFEEFSHAVHVVKPFILPKYWQRYRVLDYGLDMLACYWIAIDTHNNAFVYKELYQSNLIVSEAGAKIKELTNETIRLTYAPPDLWNRQSQSGKSTAQLFLENNIVMTQANNDRVQGWYNLKEWLKPYKIRDEFGDKDDPLITTSKLKIFSNCVNLIRTLPQLQADEKDPNDVATEPHELTHAPDAIRYWCSMWMLASTIPVTEKQFTFAIEKPQPNSYTGDNIDNSYINFGS